MLNRVIIQGRLASDVTLRYTQSGIPVATARIAVDRDFKGKPTGATDFVNIVAWRGAGEFLSKFFAKGRMVVVDGRLQMRDWTDRDGNKRTSAEVVADHVYFGDSKRDGDSCNTYQGNEPSGYGPPDGGQFSEMTDDEYSPF